MYFCPGANHAPHHCPKEWADKYKGKFDMGYEKIREQILANQKKMGIMPESTELSPMNPLGDMKSVDGKPFPMTDMVRPWTRSPRMRRSSSNGWRRCTQAIPATPITRSGG
jgi:arylsulfatase